ncbi:MAG: HAD-IC family P-type ATPase [Myxococcaceae bacterium]|nr:HAD-IC family P-type ATPase [Myxococcaceae bacterium]
MVSPQERDEHRHWHALHAAEAVAAIESDATSGLSLDEARRRLERFGPNALPEARRRTLAAVFLGQFKSPLIYLLLVAALIALVLGHRSDAAVIFTVVLLNALIGAFQEGRAERALEALRKLATHRARVVREGQERMVEAREVVPGDVLLLEAGDAIAADARLLGGAALQIAEAALTGESVPVAKSLLPLAPDTPLADRRNMLYAGTHVTAGRARAVVVGTGLATEIGHIATLAETAKEPMTPLERRVAQFGRYVIGAAGATFLLVVAIGLLRSVPMGQILMVGISQLVGVIPEGLPVAMTIALAAGVQRMARRRAVVRRLAAVETLGSTTVICSDKTGTLTRNEMTVTALFLPDGRELTVTGTGYAPVGKLLEGAREVDPARDEGLRALLEAGALCNDAQLQWPGEAPPQCKTLGDPTEVALLTLAIKGGAIPEELRARFPRRAEIPFDPSTKMMATQHETPTGPRVVLKGAPEAVLELCRAARRNGVDAPLDEDARRELRAAADRMAAGALRVLAVAIVEGAEIDGRAGFSAFRDRATLLGLVGQIDPPRPEVKDAVERCRAAGIKPVMVTGDHKATGRAIARALGIANEGDVAVDGRELEQMTDVELADRIEDISVFARVHPAQKLRIVDAYQKRNEVVAMTGDGVNDAPALVKADVGVAMGITGTEVAKEAAKIVIADDNFATIVAAVEEGRVVYRNIKKAVLLLFSTSAAEVLVLLLAMLLGYPPPFAAVQILWNNLVTEGVITVNLVMEPPEGDEMGQRPISRDEPLLTRMLLTRMGLMVPAIVVSTLGWFIVRTAQGVPEAQVRTETFTLLAICEWFNVLNCRSEQRSAFGLGLFRNPWLLGGLVVGNLLQVAVVFWTPLGRIFHTVPFSLTEAVELAIVGSLVLWVEEGRKLIVRRRATRLGRAGFPPAPSRAPPRPAGRAPRG